jgi:hypothetical protein
MKTRRTNLANHRAAVVCIFCKSINTYFFFKLNPCGHSPYVTSHVTTDGQSASLSWCQAPIWDLRSDFYFCQTVVGLLMWGALSDEGTGLSFTIYNVQYIYILHVITRMYVKYIQGLCQSRLSTAVPYL